MAVIDGPTLDHLVLRCADIEATRAFYELIGIAFDREKHGAGPSHYAGSLGGTILELYPASAKRPPETGLRLGIDVRDVEVVLVRLRAARLCSWSDRGPTIADPDGRVVALRQPDRPDTEPDPPRGRVAQGLPLSDELLGQRVTAIVAAEEAEDVFTMLWLRIDGSPWWLRFFADADLLVCEEWPFEQTFEDFAEVALLDLTDRLTPDGGRIRSAWGADEDALRIATATGDLTITRTSDHLTATVDRHIRAAIASRVVQRGQEESTNR